MLTLNDLYEYTDILSLATQPGLGFNPDFDDGPRHIMIIRLLREGVPGRFEFKVGWPDHDFSHGSDIWGEFQSALAQQLPTLTSADILTPNEVRLQLMLPIQAAS